jgi:hypothetical protein
MIKHSACHFTLQYTNLNLPPNVERPDLRRKRYPGAGEDGDDERRHKVRYHCDMRSSMGWLGQWSHPRENQARICNRGSPGAGRKGAAGVDGGLPGKVKALNRNSWQPARIVSQTACEVGHRARGSVGLTVTPGRFAGRHDFAEVSLIEREAQVPATPYYRLTVLRRSWILAIVLAALASAATAAETYIQTELDSNGQLRIMTRRHREIVPGKDRGQVGFVKVAISPDGHSVGWLAMYPGDDVSGPVPMKLVIYSGENLRSFTGSGLPIRRWCFQAEGKQVAFEQETVYGGSGVHYELRDIATGELVAKYDPDSNPQVTEKPPRWVAEVDSKP